MLRSIAVASCLFFVTLMMLSNHAVLSQRHPQHNTKSQDGFPGLAGHPGNDAPTTIGNRVLPHSKRLTILLSEYSHGDIYDSPYPFQKVWEFYAAKVGITKENPVMLPDMGAFCYTLADPDAVYWDISPQMRSAVIVKHTKDETVTIMISQAKNAPSTHVVLSYVLNDDARRAHDRRLIQLIKERQKEFRAKKHDRT